MRNSAGILVLFGLALVGCSDSSIGSAKAEGGVPTPEGPTAEETAAFLVAGLEEGAKVFALGGSIQSDSAKIEGRKPLTYLTQNDTKTTVTQVDGCNYQIDLIRTNQHSRYFVDFSKLYLTDEPVFSEKEKKYRISYAELPVGYECFQHIKPTENEKACSTSGSVSALALNADAKRVHDAYKYMRENFCQGRAF